MFLLKDWTSKNSLNKKQDILVSNSSNFFKSFYWNFNLKNKYKYFYKFREDDFLYSFKIFKLFFKRDADIINKLFKDLFRYHYKSNIKFINETIEILSNTFKIYQPIGFILPSNYDWVSILISEICQSKGVKTFVLLDGFYLFSSKIDFPKNEKNSKNIFDYHFSYGQFFSKVLRQNGVNKKNIINIKPPFLKIDSLKSYKKYDACILAYDPYIFNLNTTWDKQILIELSILKVLQKINYKNIVLKIKKSSHKKAKSQEKSVEMYKTMFKKIYNKDLKLNLEIETGDFKKVLEKSSLVIGGLSTAYIESSFYNVPYYIFEPFENGIYDLNLIVSNSYINRKEINLEKNILKKNWKKIKFKNSNFNKNLSEINFKKFI